MHAQPNPSSQLTADPLADAVTVLKNIDITDPSSRPDTEDAHNRVNLAITYLRHADEILRSLAKENYVLGVITKLGDYDREELRRTRPVVDEARSIAAWLNDIADIGAHAGDVRRRADRLQETVADYDLWDRASRFPDDAATWPKRPEAADERA